MIIEKIILFIVCFLIIIFSAKCQEIEPEPTPIKKTYKEEFVSKDTIYIQLGAGVNVTALFRSKVSSLDLLYCNFDFLYKREDIIFKSFFLSTYNEIDSSETSAMFQSLTYKYIGISLGIETAIKTAINNSDFLAGVCFQNLYLGTGVFYKTDETIEANTRFLHSWNNAQLSVIGTYNFSLKQSFVLFSIVKVFRLKK